MQSILYIHYFYIGNINDIAKHKIRKIQQKKKNVIITSRCYCFYVKLLRWKMNIKSKRIFL